MTEDIKLHQLAGAIHVANSLHDKQYRKYTGEPYICHCIEVLNLLIEHDANLAEEYLSAAVLHDTIEDTHATYESLRDFFGETTAQTVVWLSDVSTKADGSREVRKKMDREHIWKAPYEAQLIKVADMISNSKSILRRDPAFAKIYIREKELLLEGLMDQVKEHSLYAFTIAIIKEYHRHAQESN